MMPSFTPTRRPMSFLFGSDEAVASTPSLTPRQEGLLNSLIGKSQGAVGPTFDFLTRLLSGDESLFEELDAPAIRAFEEQIAPGIAERFSAAGAGSQRSSAFQQQLASAGAGLARGLSENRTALRMGAADRLSQLLDRPLGVKATPNQQLVPADYGFLGNFLLQSPQLATNLIGLKMLTGARA